jgi:NADP-dependent 3-hydroxy acid dehydrogenase YdfG
VTGLAGKTAVVTGGSRGIGLAIATTLSHAGVKVVIVARGAADLAAAAKALGPGASAVTCDLGDRAAVERAIASIQQEHGAPDVVVNNAGIFRVAPLHGTDADDFAAALQVNLFAPFLFIRAFVAAMKERGSGHIITIGSIADRMIFPENAAYAATKFGARAMHEVLRAELKGTGVRASLVSPGPVNTGLWDEVDPDNQPGFTPRSAMLAPDAVAAAVQYALTQPPEVNVDELRLSRA